MGIVQSFPIFSKNHAACIYKHEIIFTPKVETYSKISKKIDETKISILSKSYEILKKQQFALSFTIYVDEKLYGLNKKNRRLAEKKVIDISFDAKTYDEKIEISNKMECQLRLFYCNYA